MSPIRPNRVLFAATLLTAAAAALALAGVACGSSSSALVQTDDAGGANDASPGDAPGNDSVRDAGSDVAQSPAIDASALHPCPTADGGAFSVTGVTCLNFTPADTGAKSTGENATVPHYAVRPAGPAPSSLVLFLVGSGGKPSGVVRGDPAVNVYAAIAANGRAALGLSYSNVASLGKICAHVDACYLPSRMNIILGEAEPEAGIAVTFDEGIVDRTARALRYLAAGDPQGGWGSFLTTLDPNAPPKTSIAWSKIMVAGHSQGGGHAAAIGKLFPVPRVVQLSSTCDSVNNLAVSWTNGASGTWASDPTAFYGLAATSVLDAVGTGDTTCPFHTDNWTNLGMKKDHRNDAAEICGATGDTHSASLQCGDNYPAWVALFQ